LSGHGYTLRSIALDGALLLSREPLNPLHELAPFGADLSKKATALFSAQVFLPGGTIFAEGYGRVNPNGPSRYTFPILGGTGTYANVRGYVNVHDLRDDRTNIQFHLLP
jgi:hypothetical protein